MRIREVKIGDVEVISHSYARETMGWDEPIPNFETRYPGILESCLITPFMIFVGKTPYRGLIKKSAVLFYLMIKNHPFQNGNKRIALATLLTLLYKNKKWLNVGTREFYNFAKWVASSPPEVKTQTIDAIEAFIKRYILDLAEERKAQGEKKH